MKQILYLLGLLLLCSCNLEKDIDVDLPNHTPQLVVECYLVPGEPYRATVLESSGYFDAPVPPLVPSAQVTILKNGRPLNLTYRPVLHEASGRYFTHSSRDIVSTKPGDVFELRVTDAAGRKLSGFTKVLPVVPIEAVEWKFNDKNKAYLLMSFQDDPNAVNYYRYMTHRDSLSSGSDRDFNLNDNLTNGKRISVGSAYDYEEGDTLIVSLFHLEPAYYEYLNSVDEAKDANGNPFAQPSLIRSSVQGGIGIFTNISLDRKRVILTR